MTRPVRYFGPHREPAVLVQDFGELREGMVVWISPCPMCQSNHRIGVVNVDELMADVAPPPLCHPHVDTAIRRRAMNHWRCLYRVVDEKLDADPTGERTARELERVR